MRTPAGAIVVWLCVALAAGAQETTGTLLGVVRDSSGGLIAGASVKATNLDTGRTHTTQTDAQGNYALTLLPIGRYEVSAEHAGFKKAVWPDVTLHVGERLTVSFSLDVGQITETVQVSAQVSRVNTEEGSVSELLGTHEIQMMPVNGRYFNQLVTLMPGTVSYISQGPVLLAFNRATVAVNGQRPNTNNWATDGVYNVDTGGGWNFNDSPPIDTVAEFRLLRGNYDAESGTVAGGHVNIISRSGGREFHGTLHEFFRNNNLDARNFFSAVVPPLRFNNFGFTVGGPVFIPELYSRSHERTFFFASMDWQRIRRGTTYTQTVPTEAMRRGDFSGLARVIRDPATGQPFPGNIIPPARIDPNALALTKLIPMPNRPGSALNWTGEPVLRINYRQDLLRVDHRVTDSTQAMFRISRNNYFFQSPEGAGFPEFVRQRDSTGGNLVASVISSLSPSLQNEVIFGYTWNKLPQRPIGNLDPRNYGVNIPQIFPDTPETYPLSSMALNAVIAKIPNVALTGYGGLSIGNAWNNATDIYQFNDNVSKLIGSHMLKFGVLFQREWKFEPTNTDVEGSFTFNGSYSGDAYADFLLGRAYSYNEPNTVNFLNNLRTTFEAYVNDRWKVTRRFSLSLGLRYSYFQIPQERDKKYRVFVPDKFDPAKAMRVTARGELLPGSGEPLNGLVEPSPYLRNQRKNFAPRISFSWDPWGQGKTVVRGGYGFYYNREILGGFILLAGNPPFAASQTVYDTFLSLPGGGTVRSFPANIGSVDLDQKVPYYQHWNFGLQRSVMSNTVLDLSYVGTKGTHILRGMNMNQPRPNADVARGAISVNAVRPYPGFGDILVREQSYASIYHSFQLSLSRNFHRGLALQVSYTASKVIDNAAYPGIYNAGADYYNQRLERGLASFDVPQILVASFVWELPVFKAQRGAAGKLLGGWQLTGIARFMSGQPVDVTLGRDIAGTGSSLQRPQIVSDPALPASERKPERMFRKEAFTAPAPATYATTSRNAVRGPGTNNWDVSFVKAFRFNEARQLEFHADLFNIFNHTQFSGVNTSFYAASFGQANSARLPREVQLGLKFVW